MLLQCTCRQAGPLGRASWWASSLLGGRRKQISSQAAAGRGRGQFGREEASGTGGGYQQRDRRTQEAARSSQHSSRQKLCHAQPGQPGPAGAAMTGQPLREELLLADAHFRATSLLWPEALSSFVAEAGELGPNAVSFVAEAGEMDPMQNLWELL